MSKKQKTRSNRNIKKIRRKKSDGEITINSYLINNKQKNVHWWRICLEILAFILAISSIGASFYFSSPIKLNIWHNISEKGDTLVIYGKNEDFFRSTGNIYLYKLEISGFKPYDLLTGNDTLKHGEQKLLFKLPINVKEENIIISNNETDASFRIPSPQLISIAEKKSISYKITCESCPDQGVIMRIPDFRSFTIDLFMNSSDRTISGKIPIYSWKETKFEDVIK